MNIYIKTDYTESEWEIIQEILKNGINIKIYKNGDYLGGRLLSRVELSIFHFIRGSRRLGILTNEAKILEKIYQDKFPAEFETIKKYL